jgi:cation transport protein ChaC
MHDGVVPIVWGSIYAIPQEQESSEAVWEYLDHREKDGYSLKEVDVFSIVDGVEVMIERAVSPLHSSLSNCDWD